MDQVEYVACMRPIQADELIGMDGEVQVSSELTTLFMSLLGALAFCLLTRPDLAVFVSALQRQTHHVLVVHVRKLNIRLRWAQRHPLKLIYAPMQCQRHLLVHSDSGYRREYKDGDPEGRSTRGWNTMRLGEGDHFNRVIHLLDWTVGTHKVVVRSTFTAETQAAVSAADAMLCTGLALHEITLGPVSLPIAMQLRENGGYCFTMGLAVDSMGLVSALSIDPVRAPVERSMYAHVAWLQQLLKLNILAYINWIDIRDMTSDGHTKGSIRRDALRQLAGGKLLQRHAAKPAVVRASVTNVA